VLPLTNHTLDSDHLASCLEASSTAEPSAHPLDEGKDVSPVLISPLECLALDPLLSPSSIDVPTATVDQVTSPTVSNLDQGKATPPTASPTMASFAAAFSMPTVPLCVSNQIFHHLSLPRFSPRLFICSVTSVLDAMATVFLTNHCCILFCGDNLSVCPLLRYPILLIQTSH